MTRSTTILALAVMVASMSSASSYRAPITRAELVRNKQAMFDAAAPGDQKPWEKYFADDSLYFDENGRGMGKTALVEDVAPLPPGLFGQHESCES
jgi:hypothetical protein